MQTILSMVFPDDLSPPAALRKKIAALLLFCALFPASCRKYRESAKIAAKFH